MVAANEPTLSILSCKVFYEYLCTSLLNFHLDQSLLQAALCLFDGALHLDFVCTVEGFEPVQWDCFIISLPCSYNMIKAIRVQ